MDNDLMLNNRLKDCGTVTLKDVTYEALLSFHDEINKVNHVSSEDHSSLLFQKKLYRRLAVNDKSCGEI
ncbi:Cell division cycle-related protein [Trichinella spiralis]|uniref:Cell division cycle-related protein n=1 Tax=Trichinella spiralis TaxID=6334 RepID=A0ABR3KDP2_TRISP